MDNNLIIFQINNLSELSEIKQTHEIRKLGVNDRKLFNKNMRICSSGIKKLFPDRISESKWNAWCNGGIYNFLLFENGNPVARCGIDSSRGDVWEVACVCTAPKCRSKGLAKELAAYVTRQVIEQSKKPIIITSAHNTAMLKVIDSVGFKFDYGEFLPIKFSKLTANIFDVYKEWSIKTYAEHLKKSSEVKKGTEFAEAKAEFEDVYPDGADTKDTWLYVAQNESGEKIGVFGYQKSPYGADTAFVTEVVTREDFRGKGYAKSALAALQEDAKQKGFTKMALNVFKHSPAYTMYVKSGFRVIEEYKGSCIMEKKL